MTTKYDAKKTKKEKSIKLRKINGTNENQWEGDVHDNDFSTRVDEGKHEETLPILEFKILKFLKKYHKDFEPFISFLS